MRLGFSQAAASTFTSALRPRKDRPQDLLRQITYERALAYDVLGRKGNSRRELERLYAEAPDFEDVGARLGLNAEPPPSEAKHEIEHLGAVDAETSPESATASKSEPATPEPFLQTKAGSESNGWYINNKGPFSTREEALAAYRTGNL